MTTTINEIVTTIRALAAEQPDRHSDCTYTHGGAPECIVGHALLKLDPAFLEYLDGANNAQGFREVLLELRRAGLIAAPDGGLAELADARGEGWICTVQSLQDDGRTWEAAIAEAGAL